MEVVIEYVLLDNLLIDAVILYCTNKITKVPTNWWGLFGAALFGALFALFCPLLNFGGLLWIVVKCLVAFIIVLLSNLNLYKIVLRTVCFVLLTFMFGGALIAICYFVGVNVVEGSTLVYFSSVPIGSALGLGCIFVLVLLRLAKSLYTNIRFSQYLINVNLTINNKTIELTGYLDTGNNLCTKENLPIIILKEDSLKHWFSVDERMYILMGKYNLTKLKKPQKIKISGVNAKGDILVFEADNLSINHRDYAVAVGIDNSRHFKDFSVLLNNRIGDILC